MPTVKDAIAAAEEEPEPAAWHSDDGGSCSTLPGGALQARITSALHLQRTGHHPRAANLLCTSAKRLTVRPTAPERRRGILTAATLRAALAFARVCGVMRVDGAVPRDTVREVRVAVEAHWSSRREALFAAVARSAAASPTGRAFFESEDAAMRGDARRFELRLPATAPFTQRNLTASPPVLALLRLLMGQRERQQEDGSARASKVEMELDTFSYVQSLPGAAAQRWHTDVAALFDSAGGGGGGAGAGAGAEAGARSSSSAPAEGDAKLMAGDEEKVEAAETFSVSPAHGIVAVVPLVDMTAENGPTEFLTGSHAAAFPSGDAFWEKTGEPGGAADGGGGAAAGVCEKTPTLTFPADAGSVVLFDLRLRHRGTANRGRAARPILYMSYVRSWFHDPTNFKAPQTAEWDALGGVAAAAARGRDGEAAAAAPYMKRLFTRVDSRMYTQRLEEWVTAHGGDVGAMRSSGAYTQRGI